MVKTIFENIREEMIVEIQFNYENWEGIENWEFRNRMGAVD